MKHRRFLLVVIIASDYRHVIFLIKDYKLIKIIQNIWFELRIYEKDKLLP